MRARTGTMTEKERAKALARREKPDRVPLMPISVGFPTVYAKTSIADAYNKPEVALAAQCKAAQDFGWVFVPSLICGISLGWEFGGDIKWPSDEFDQAPKITRSPVDTPDEAMKLQLPDAKSAGFTPLHMKFCRLASKEKLDNKPFDVAFRLGGPFSFAALIPGPDKFIKWLIKEPEAVHRLLRLSTDYIIDTAKYWKDTFGTENVLPFYSEAITSNQLIPSRYFEQFALPYLKEIHEKVLAMGYKAFYVHICGEQNLNLPHWAKIPMGDPGIVSFGHEVDLETAAKYFPNDIIFGNLEPVIVQTGTPKEVYEASRKVIEKGKELPTGFIFSTGCEMPPFSPPENVMAMTKAVNDFGWYK